MSCLFSLMCFLSGASLYQSLIVLETNKTSVDLSTVGIDISAMTSLPFKLTTCSYSVVILKDAKSNMFTVAFNNKHLGKVYVGIRCDGDDCVDHVKHKETKRTFCSAPVSFLLSWDRAELVLGEGSQIGYVAMVSYPLNSNIVSAIIWSNASKTVSTWELDIEASVESGSAPSTGQSESKTEASGSAEQSESANETSGSTKQSESGNETLAFTGQMESTGQSKFGSETLDSDEATDQSESGIKKTDTYEEGTNDDRSSAPSSIAILASVKEGLSCLFVAIIYLWV